MSGLASNRLINETVLFAMPELPTSNVALMEAAIIIDGARHRTARQLEGKFTYELAERVVRETFAHELDGTSPSTPPSTAPASSGIFGDLDQKLHAEIADFLGANGSGDQA